MASRARMTHDDFETVRVLYDPNAGAQASATAGAMNWGIDLMRVKRNGLLCIRKIISPTDMRERLGFQEAHILRCFDNQHINKFIHYQPHTLQGPDQQMHDIQCLYVKYCDGGALSSMYTRFREHNARIPEEFVWHIFRSMADALAVLHFGQNRTRRGEPAEFDYNYTVHGDIKPQNLFLEINDGGTFPTVVLGDFGACLTRYQLREMHRRGQARRPMRLTPAYTAPEARDHTGIFSDVFSLGVIILQLIGGWNSQPVTTAAQLDRIETRAYSSQLNRMLRATLALDFNQRIRSCDLVTQLDSAMMETVAAGKIKSPDQDVSLPEWALPRDGDRQPARFRRGRPAPRDSNPAAGPSRGASGRARGAARNGVPGLAPIREVPTIDGLSLADQLDGASSSPRAPPAQMPPLDPSWSERATAIFGPQTPARMSSLDSSWSERATAILGPTTPARTPFAAPRARHNPPPSRAQPTRGPTRAPATGHPPSRGPSSSNPGTRHPPNEHLPSWMTVMNDIADGNADQDITPQFDEEGIPMWTVERPPPNYATVDPDRGQRASAGQAAHRSERSSATRGSVSRNGTSNGGPQLERSNSRASASTAAAAAVDLGDLDHVWVNARPSAITMARQFVQ